MRKQLRNLKKNLKLNGIKPGNKSRQERLPRWQLHAGSSGCSQLQVDDRPRGFSSEDIAHLQGR